MAKASTLHSYSEHLLALQYIIHCGYQKRNTEKVAGDYQLIHISTPNRLLFVLLHI